eukprot:Skav228095  [mRNA]  locus=scaffold784:61748:68672:+ [translate_table: standard]
MTVTSVRTPLDLSREVSFAHDTGTLEGSNGGTPSADSMTWKQAKPSPVGSRIVERSSIVDQANTVEIRRLTNCVAKLEGHLNAQEELLAAERAQHKEDVKLKPVSGM